MSEVADHSVKLLIGASIFLGKGVSWGKYESLYKAVYVAEGQRVLRQDGFLFVIQTDAYVGGEVVARNVLLPTMLLGAGYRLIDVKVWKRRAADFFQPPYSQVFVFAPKDSKHSRTGLQKHNGYLQGIWDYPQSAGGAINGYPDGLCRLLIDAATQAGDVICDPFAGTGRLLGVAATRGRRAVGYEIDESLRLIVAGNLSMAGKGLV